MSVLQKREDQLPAKGPPRDRVVSQPLCILLIAIALAGIAVWQLRQPSARGQLGPWLLFLAAILSAAWVLRKLEPVPAVGGFASATIAEISRRRRVTGLVLVCIAVLASGAVFGRLWPDYRNRWQGLAPLWIGAMILFLVGSWLIGTVGRASPRASATVGAPAHLGGSRWLEMLAFALILGLAIFLRIYRLDSIPPGIFIDETNGALDALYVLQGRPLSPFVTGWYGIPSAFVYCMAGVYQLFGVNVLSLKLVSLIPAILTVPALYLLARQLYGPLLGLLAMFLLAISRWHLTISRWGWIVVVPPLVQVLSFYFLFKALRRGRALDYGISGLLAGLSIYTYLSARLAVLTLALCAAYWILSDPDGVRAGFVRSGLGIVLLGLAALVVVSPLAVTYIRDPSTFGSRVAEVSVFNDIKREGSILPLEQNIVDMLRFFHQSGDRNPRHNLPGEPMLDPFTGILFGIGFALAILNLRDHRQVLLLLWLVIGLSGSFLSLHQESPQAFRSLIALPAVIMIAACALERLAGVIRRQIAVTHFGNGLPQMSSLASAGLIILVCGGAALWESHIYFGPQAASPAVRGAFNAAGTDMARQVITALQSGESVYVSPSFAAFSPLRFLAYGYASTTSGGNSLENPPYRLMVPEVNMPLADNGRDALVLLDSQYWSLRDYIVSFYPRSSIDLMETLDHTPIAMRVQIPRAQIVALQGISEHDTYQDGRQGQHVVPQVEFSSPPDVTQVEWDGAIRLNASGYYQFLPYGGLQVLIDGRVATDRQFLGRGLYGLHVTRLPDSIGPGGLLWSVNDSGAVPVPAEVLFNMPGPRQGLRASYWGNEDWFGKPLFQQTTPFLLLVWPDRALPTNVFSARFTGALHIAQAGTYHFRVEVDDGARLSVDGKVLGEGLIPGQPNTFEVSADLDARDHPIEIDYVQNGGSNQLRFFWRTGDQPWTPVPPAALLPSP